MPTSLLWSDFVLDEEAVKSWSELSSVDDGTSDIADVAKLLGHAKFVG